MATGFNLIIYIIVKFIITVLTLSCQIPAAAFGPIVNIGCGFGRLYAFVIKNIGVHLGLELIKRKTNIYFLNSNLEEGIYAIVGAAATVAAATKTTCMALIILEISGQTQHAIPIFIGVIISTRVIDKLSISIDDIMLDFKALPYIPTLGNPATYTEPVSTFMNTNFYFLTKDSRLADIPVIMHKVKKQNIHIPVVESIYKKKLLFTLKSGTLLQYLITSFNK